MEYVDINGDTFFIPSYLDEESKEVLKQSLKYFPNPTESNKFYEVSKDISLWYQGDGVNDVPFFSIDNEGNPNIKYSKGLILSNTCGIDPANTRSNDTMVNFAKIINLNLFIEFMKTKGFDEDRIESIVKDLKANRINNFVFIPGFTRNNYVFPDSIVQLDKISSLPLGKFLDKYKFEYKTEENDNGDRLFSFSNYGFYLMVIKISIFFCRFSEKIDRFKTFN